MASPLTAGVTCWPAPTQSVTPGRALFAKGLAKGCTSAHLQAIFSTFGTVTDCQIARHRSGRSAGFAIVTFLRHEEAVAAMQAVDNLMFMGRRLSVKWFSPERALEGTSHGVDVLNMQALQHALQLTQLQPADLMAQLAQMLDSPRLAPQQPQNAHVSAWLDNFVLAQQQQQRDSPLAQTVHDAAQSQSPLDLLNFSGLSLTDVQSAGMGVVPPAHGLATHPATPSSLDVPDGAVYVTAGVNTGNKGAAVGGNFALAHSRLAKWCTAPGSAAGQSSAAPSLTDDASSETASVHASDDSSIATSVQLAQTSSEMPSCSTEGSSPAGGVVRTETPHVTSTVAPPVSLPAVTVAPAPTAQVVTTPNSGVNLAPQVLSPVNSLSEMDETLLRNRALAAAAAAAAVAARPGVIGSDPGGSLHQPMVLKRGSAPTFGSVAPLMPGAPVLAPLRTATTAQLSSQPQVHHHHAHHHAVHHHHHAHHVPRGSGRQTAMPSYNSCGGGVPAPTDASLQQALRLQQALAEQARSVSAQYMDALAKLEAAREQVVAAASLLNRNSGMAAAAAALPMPPASLPPPVHQMPPQQMGALMGGHTMASPMHPYLAQSPAATQGCMPDFGSLFMFQNAASTMSRPLY